MNLAVSGVAAFRLLISIAAVATIGVIVADDFGARSLPEPLRSARAQAKEAVLAASKRRPTLGALRLMLVIGYVAALVALGLFMPWSPWIYLLLSLGWTVLSVWDAPHILSRSCVLFYEASLLLNGALLALLALCSLSPIAARFVSN